jgi:hypothetical protein
MNWSRHKFDLFDTYKTPRVCGKLSPTASRVW